ncbi:MAG: hypothetical protein AAB340_03100 [Patescibacteria group bacterium]
MKNKELGYTEDEDGGEVEGGIEGENSDETPLEQPIEEKKDSQDKLGSHLESLATKLDTVKDTILVFAGALKEARMKGGEQNAVIDGLRKDLETAKKRIGGFQTGSENAKRAREKLEEQIQSMEDQLESMRTSHAEEIRAANEKVEIIEQEKVESDVNLSLAKTAAEKARIALSDFTSEIEGMIANSKKGLEESAEIRLKEARKDALVGKTGTSALARLRAKKRK